MKNDDTSGVAPTGDSLAAALAKGYTGSTFVTDFHGPKVTLRYTTNEAAEKAHDALTEAIDAELAKRAAGVAPTAEPQPLTEDQIVEHGRYWSNRKFAEGASRFLIDFARAIERAHGIGVPVGPPWCCEKGEALNIKVCPECDATSRAYSAAAGVAPTGEVLRDSDVEDVWQSIVDAMPEAGERERRIAFAKAIQSARAVQL